MPAFRVPVATYRVQFNQSFRFVDGRDLVPYLSDLGVTDLYSSPRFAARRGSSHGYDVANPMRINSELGTEEDFDELAEKLRHYEMGLLLDVVPNHMAASSENPWWLDVLENGLASEYAAFFDIDWHPAASKAAFLQENRVLLPILGDLYGKVLQDQELVLKIDDTGLFIRYCEAKLPLDPKTYRSILEYGVQLSGSAELAAVVEEVDRLPARTETDPARIAARRRDKENIKRRLWHLYHTHPEIKSALDEILHLFNGVRDDPKSFDSLDQILSEQAYRIAFWKIAYEEINYRRFFDINGLVGLRVEIPEVFEIRHRKIVDLVRSGKITGLRIDHVDGMYDPLGYLVRLKEAMEAKFYVVVEKVLGARETLPPEWPISGTTGYEFLNALNGIFIDSQGLAALEQIYNRLTGNQAPFAEVCYACNKQAMERLFPGEINALGRDLAGLAARHRQARDIPLSELMQVLVEVTACLPIYRTYIRDLDIAPRDREYLERALQVARNRTPEERVSSEAFAFIRSVLLLDAPYYLEQQKDAWLRFVMRWQQFTGPVMAKGLEDTASYIHNSLISRNEVGSDPLREDPPLDVPSFHRFNQTLREHWPHGLNATSTHDSKRGEDVRARINVLSEIPGQWESCLNQWRKWNEAKKHVASGIPVPTAAEEILIYQTLLGAWPLDAADEPSFPDRVKEFLIKAAREAKIHSSWIRPNEAHENALRAFVDAVLEPSGNPFLDSFLEFQKRIAFFGALNSLSQVLLKIGAPGVPDFYQGTELWNFSLVDPDNRRPVDYRKRIFLLETLQRREAEDRPQLVRDLVRCWQDDSLKLYLTCKALSFRRANRELFLDGGYVPVVTTGERSDNVCAFARRAGGHWALVVVPLRVSRLEYRTPSLCPSGWRTTSLQIPEKAPSRWSDALTGGILDATGQALALEQIFQNFPVALLEGRVED